MLPNDVKISGEENSLEEELPAMGSKKRKVEEGVS